MKKAYFIGLLLSVVLFSASAFADGIKCDTLRDAEDYWNHGEKVVGADCVETIIKKEPGNTRAHFLKGQYCLENGDLKCAKEKFSSPEVRERFSKEISEAYKKQGDVLVSSGRLEAAADMYAAATTDNPGLGQKIANDMFQKGKASGSDGYFSIASKVGGTEMDKKIGAFIADQTPAKKTEAEKVDNLEKATRYDRKFSDLYLASKEKLGRGYLEQAKEFAKKVGQETQAEKFKALARKYLGDATVNSELPEAKIYTPGTYTFSLKSGEQTESWIIFQDGRIPHWNISSHDRKYQIVYDDGQIVDSWKVDRLPANKYKFRFVAVTDQPEIKMVIWY